MPSAKFVVTVAIISVLSNMAVAHYAARKQ
jgi:hypothetical protein